MTTGYAEELREKAERGEVKPEHAMCTDLVERPTVSVFNLIPEDDKTKTVWVQWFGETRDLPLPVNAQFNFSICADPYAVEWFLHPERFEVMFLGQVKDWPGDEAAKQSVAWNLTNGDLDGWIFYAVSHHYHMKYDSGEGPGSVATGIALLADPTFGIITPRSFTDLSVSQCGQRCLHCVAV